MLSTQRKEFDEKKKDETAYPRDFGRWYALDYFLRPRSLKGKRFWITTWTTVLVALLCIATLLPALHRTHQAAPLSKAHAMLGNDCAACHDRSLQPVFRLFGSHDAVSVSDAKCNACHQGAIHNTKVAHDANCASCHREHQSHEILATHVADRNCTACHGDLPAHANAKTLYHQSITSFTRDHPEFAWSAAGKKDPSKIHFNHKAHLDLDLADLKSADLKGLGKKLACADCHQLDDERKYMKPINYDQHCKQCHALNVGLIGDFAADLKAAVKDFSKTALPHKEPALVRAVLRDRLVEFALVNKIGGAEAPSVPRPLPWRPEVTDKQWSWAKEHAKKPEELLFMNKQWQKQETLTGCAHCHVEKDRAGGLPTYEKSDIPSRWNVHSVFNHNSHRTMKCEDCHDKNAAGIKVADSKTAADILLPTIKSCQECHTGGNNGARNACVECHRYHQR